MGWTLAAMSLAINILLSVAHMGLLGDRVAIGAVPPATSVSVEATLLVALAQICTDHGLDQRGVQGKSPKSGFLPTCPLCFFFATTTLILAMGQLLLILRRVEIDRLRPTVEARRLGELLQRIELPRAPPFIRIAA